MRGFRVVRQCPAVHGPKRPAARRERTDRQRRLQHHAYGLPASERERDRDRQRTVHSLLSPEYWVFPDRQNCEVRWRKSALEGTIDLPEGEKVYLTHDNAGFAAAPAMEMLKVDPSGRYSLMIEGSLDPGLTVDVYIIQYNAAGRSRTDRSRFDGFLWTDVAIRPDSVAIRLAIRLAGRGTFRFDHVDLHAPQSKRNTGPFP